MKVSEELGDGFENLLKASLHMTVMKGSQGSFPVLGVLRVVVQVSSAGLAQLRVTPLLLETGSFHEVMRKHSREVRCG